MRIAYPGIICGFTAIALAGAAGGAPVVAINSEVAGDALSRPVATFDDSDYVTVLETYVDAQGLVNYKGLQANRAVLDRFASALADLSSATYDSWDERTKIAFWINAYNALTLKTIVDHYPIQSSFLASLRFPKNSIRQISGVWDTLGHTVMGQRVTLDQIEHEILRKDFEEPRIHMALVCASIGCPLLRREPYQGGRLSEQLADQTRQFLKNPRNFRISREAKRVYVSSIFKWFGEDFVGTYSPEKGFAQLNDTQRAALHFISQHLGESDRAYLASATYSVEHLDYDWSLNEQ